MKSLTGKIIIGVLACTILISSVGIAQVTHICKLALSGMEKTTCSTFNLDQHECCNEMRPVEGSTSTDDPCCTDEIRYFHNSIHGTLHETLKSFTLNATFVMLFHYHFLAPVVVSSLVAVEEVKPEPFKTGQKTLIFIQSFLI